MIEKAVERTGLKVKQLLNGARLRIRTRKEVLGREFIFPEILFDSKWFDLHEGSLARPAGVRLEPN
jgi:hypothetical protein